MTKNENVRKIRRITTLNILARSLPKHFPKMFERLLTQISPENELEKA